jgi:phage gpG-like protein
MTAMARIAANLQNKDRVMHALGLRAVGIVQGTVKAGKFTPNAPLTRAVKQGDKVLRDRGHLASSIDYRVSGDMVIVGTNHPAARILHYGGTVRPKSTRFLALPAGARTRSLMRQYGQTARACIEGMKNAGYQVWFSRSDGGAGQIYAKNGKRGKTFVLYFLKSSVKIPARPFMRLGDDGVKKLSRVLRQEMTR